MLSKLIILSTVSAVFSNPGSHWTEEEAVIVKAKLYAIIGASGTKTSEEYLSLHPELGLTSWPDFKSQPSAPKFLR